MKQQILLINGEKIPLKEWQKTHNLPYNKVSEHIYLTEVTNNHTIDSKLILAETTISLFEKIRESLGNKPINIIRGFSTQKKQNSIIKKYNKTKRQGLAANVSTHTYGYALDLDGESKKDIVTLRNTIVYVCHKINFPYYRIGWKKYLDAGMTSLHFDTAPFFFNHQNGNFKEDNVSYTWRIPKLEW